MLTGAFAMIITLVIVGVTRIDDRVASDSRVLAVAGRHSGLANDYVVSVLARSDGLPADPDSAAEALTENIEVLANGGSTTGLRGSSHNQFAVAAAEGARVRAYLEHVRTLDAQLVEAGERALALDHDDPAFAPAVTDLRVQAALLGTATSDLVAEMTGEHERAIGAALRTHTIVTGLTGSGALVLAVFAGRVARRRERSRAEALLAEAPDLTVVISPDGKMRYVNPTWRWLLSEGSDLAGSLHPDDADRVVAGLGSATIAGGDRADLKARIGRRGAGWVVVEGTITDLRHEPTIAGYVINGHDITASTDLADELAHQALHDQLTDLPNRTLFSDRVEYALARNGRSGDPVAVMFIDLDRFKTVNDSHGHAIGDQLLQAVASTLAATVRTGDTVARLGGDEFAVLLDAGVSDDLVDLLARRLLDAIHTPLLLDDNRFHPSASIGVTTSAPSATTSEILLRDADTAMYVAKAEGRNTIRRFDSTMRDRVIERTSLTNGLRTAVGAGDMTVVYQPIIDLRTGETVELEALLRWDHPERGLISPVQFIPIAEETGSIDQIGRWVLNEACQHLSSWRRRTRHLSVAVNVSAIQLADAGFILTVLDVLSGHRVPPEALTIELTETALLTNIGTARATLDALRSHGVKVAIDDFGTGYSSLGQLRDLPVDALKIDRSFVSDITPGAGRSDESGVGIIDLVTSLADRLGLRVTAEGVETHEQAITLADVGVERGQGYWFSPPVEAHLVQGLLSEPFSGRQVDRSRRTV